MNISILHGRLVDPASGLDECLSVHVADGELIALGAAPDGFQADLCLNAQDQVVCPGLVDLAASLREPGLTRKGTLASETAAAAKGGITTLVCTPDTDPVIDTPAVIKLVQRKAHQSAQARVLICAALTRGLQGQQLADMMALQRAGAVALARLGVHLWMHGYNIMHWPMRRHSGCWCCYLHRMWRCNQGVVLMPVLQQLNWVCLVFRQWLRQWH